MIAMIRNGTHQLAFLRRSVKVLLGAKKVLMRRCPSDRGTGSCESCSGCDSCDGTEGLVAISSLPEQGKIVVSLQRKNNRKRQNTYDTAISGVAASSFRV